MLYIYQVLCVVYQCMYSLVFPLQLNYICMGIVSVSMSEILLSMDNGFVVTSTALHGCTVTIH